MSAHIPVPVPVRPLHPLHPLAVQEESWWDNDVTFVAYREVRPLSDTYNGKSDVLQTMPVAPPTWQRRMIKTIRNLFYSQQESTGISLDGEAHIILQVFPNTSSRLRVYTSYDRQRDSFPSPPIADISFLLSKHPAPRGYFLDSYECTANTIRFTLDKVCISINIDAAKNILPSPSHSHSTIL